VAPHCRGHPLRWRVVAVVLLLMVAADVMLVMVVEVMVVVADATLVVLQLGGLHEVMAGRDVVLDRGVGITHRGGAQLGDRVAVAWQIQNNIRTKLGTKITTVQHMISDPDPDPHKSPNGLALWIRNHKFKEEGSGNKAVPEIRICGGPDPDPEAYIRLGSLYKIFWIRKPFT
jgi:hypothetical protein